RSDAFLRRRHRRDSREIILDAVFERETALVARRHGRDAVVRIANDVDEFAVDADGLTHRLEQLGPRGEPRAGAAALFVADHAELAIAPLPLAGDFIRIAGVLAAAVAAHARIFQQQIKNLAAIETGADEFEHVELVRDDYVRMRVEQRTDQAMAAARVAEKHAKSFDGCEVVAVRTAAVKRARIKPRPG